MTNGYTCWLCGVNPQPPDDTFCDYCRNQILGIVNDFLDDVEAVELEDEFGTIADWGKLGEKLIDEGNDE